MKILITGAAGFIGMHVAQKLKFSGHQILGLDNINTYYDTDLKISRIKNLGINTSFIEYNKIINSKFNFSFIKLDITDRVNLDKLFSENRFDSVIHLAAQAGVRYSIDHPDEYMKSNIDGFYNIIEACKKYLVSRFIFASSSSVYGNSSNTPFTTDQMTDSPISLYAATKKSNELIAHTYSHLYNLKCIGLRFFTVYGPWGRPDMAYFSFTKNIIEENPIELYNNGNMERDFTYIDDIVNTIENLIPRIDNLAKLTTPYKIFNIGNQHPVNMQYFIILLEQILGKKAFIKNLGMQLGDVYKTCSDTSETINFSGYSPIVEIEKGLKLFVQWYLDYYKINK